MMQLIGLLTLSFMFILGILYLLSFVVICGDFGYFMVVSDHYLMEVSKLWLFGLPWWISLIWGTTLIQTMEHIRKPLGRPQKKMDKSIAFLVSRFLGNGNPPSWKENSMSMDLVALAILCLPILRSEQAVLLTKCTLENQHGTQKWKFGRWVSFVNWVIFTRWAPTSYKLSYNPYKWPYKWVTGVIPLLIGVITQFITGRDPPCRFHVD